MIATYQVLLACVAGALLVTMPAAVAVMRVRSSAQPQPFQGTFTSRLALSEQEQAMFWRLVETFPLPQTVVLSQVSLAALLNAKGASGFSFSQKRAHFVLVDKDFQVRVVIELDVSAQKRRYAIDEQHDAMLKAAGYRVVRYRSVPDPDRLRNDVPLR